MPLLMLREVPRYECIRAASEEYREVDISATEACLHLLRTGDAVFRVINGHLHEHGISQGRFTVMMLLWVEEEAALTPAELADRAMVTRATITGLLDTMERDGLIERRPCDHDRRMLRVSLTKTAQAQLKQILPEHFRRMAELLIPLKPSERKTLLALLRKVATQADLMSPQGPTPPVDAGT
jgi:DNA-binding MarR family transcriptional regulator